MRLFGYDINIIKAAAPELPDVRSDRSILDIIPPFGTAYPLRRGDSTISQNLDERLIYNDPRDLFFLALPNKLTPQQCLQILRSALAGDIWQQFQLLSTMLDSWPTFRMAAHQLRESVAYSKFVVQPNSAEGEEPTEEAINRAKLVEKALRSMTPNQFNDERGLSGMVYDLCDAMLNGLAMVELVWAENAQRERLPVSAAWVHPRHYTFTSNNSVAVFDDNYNRLRFNPEQTGQSARGTVGESPDPNKFLFAQFISRSGTSLGAGFMRPLVWYWAARQFNLEWMLNTAKQYGSPFIDITYRPGAMTDTELSNLDNMLKLAGPNRRLRHPEGTVVQIHPATSLGKENPQRFLADEADKACLFLLLGQSSTTMQTPGKLGDEGVAKDVKDERVQALAQWVARNPLKQFARAVLRVNYGNEDLCPEIAADFTKPLDSQQVGSLAMAITSSRLPVRADEAYKKFGFTQPQPGDLILQDGRQVVMSEPVTQDEVAVMQQKAQVYDQLAAQQQREEQAGGGPEKGGKAEAGEAVTVKHVIRGEGRDWHKALVAATDAELDELEVLLTAAEGAEEHNGEVKAVDEWLTKLHERHWKVPAQLAERME